MSKVDPLVSALVRQRISAGLSQKAVAELAGLSQPNLARVESGRVVPRLSTLRALATALGCDLWLVKSMVERCNAALYAQVCKQPAGHPGMHSDGLGNYWRDVEAVLIALGEFIDANGTGTGAAGERLVRAYRDYLTRH